MAHGVRSLTCISHNKEVQQIVQEAEARGWVVERVRKGKHGKLIHPSGLRFVCISSTPSDHRAVKNLRAMIARIERELSNG